MFGSERDLIWDDGGAVNALKCPWIMRFWEIEEFCGCDRDFFLELFIMGDCVSHEEGNCFTEILMGSFSASLVEL